MTSPVRLAAHSLRKAVVRPQAVAAAVGAGAGHSRRMDVHVRVPLPYKIEGGTADFLSPVALKVVAVDYYKGQLNRLGRKSKVRLVALPFSL
jgi:hypothetical protein